MSDTPKEQPKESESVPRITYVGNPVNPELTKQKNPKRVAAERRFQVSTS